MPNISLFINFGISEVGVESYIYSVSSTYAVRVLVFYALGFPSVFDLEANQGLSCTKCACVTCTCLQPLEKPYYLGIWTRGVAYFSGHDDELKASVVHANQDQSSVNMQNYAQFASRYPI